MKGKKCFGLLFLLFIIFGLSLNVSSNVSATTYSLDGFLAYPFAFPVSDNSSYSDDPITYRFSSLEGITPYSLSYLSSSYNSSTGKCDYYSYVHNPYILSSTSLTYSGSFIPPFSTVIPFSVEQSCRTMLPYGFSNDNVSIPNFDSSTIPFDKSLNVNSMLPYNYMYNTINFSNIRTIDGVDYNSAFDISEFLNNPAEPGDDDYVFYSDKITSVTFPLNFDSSLEGLDSSSNLQLSGSILFSVGLSPTEFSHLRINLLGSQFYRNGSENLFSSSSTCSFSTLDYKQIDFSCIRPLSSYPNSSDFPAGSYSLSFEFYAVDSNSSLVPFSSVKQSISFSDFLLTTNEVSTDPINGSISPGGSFPNVAPGVARPDVSNGDFFGSLAGMFNFGFFNPFQPIFNLFADNSQCASIPTISSWLHTEDTQVCPFFPSSVRNVLTPVFGLSSAMLIFGFAIRWLSGSSGNLFEDSLDSHTVGRLSFRGRTVIKG